MLLELKDDRIVCAIGINAARELRAAREMITLRAQVKPEELADTKVSLMELLKKAKRERELAH